MIGVISGAHASHLISAVVLTRQGLFEPAFICCSHAHSLTCGSYASQRRRRVPRRPSARRRRRRLPRPVSDAFAQPVSPKTLLLSATCCRSCLIRSDPLSGLPLVVHHSSARHSWFFVSRVQRVLRALWHHTPLSHRAKSWHSSVHVHVCHYCQVSPLRHAALVPGTLLHLPKQGALGVLGAD